MADQNPIPYLILTVALRFWLSINFAGQTAIEDTPNDFLDWLTVFGLGIVPEFPVVANVIQFLLVNGTLIVWLGLLIKRLLNPVAN